MPPDMAPLLGQDNASIDLHTLEVARLVVDADSRWGDPARVFAALVQGLRPTP